jgi:Kef-type K+ transport system membrane component KefB/nucleotide-binding universal stress UspA family protein
MAHTDILLYLLIDLVIIIVAARAFGALAERLGQPKVIGEIVAGILLGPTVLGRINADWPRQIFPPEVPLRSIADLGLVFFMFLVGLELDTQLIRRQGKRALQISLSGILLPLIGGIIVGYVLHDVNQGGEFLPGVTARSETFTFALFLGAAMCITAFPVLARILVETGLYKTPVGTATLCAAAVDDVSAWILLAAVVGITTSGSAAAAVPALVLTLIFALFMFIVGRRLLGLLARRYDDTGRLTVDQVAVVLGGVLLAAFTTEKIGVHSIFGAFIFGLSMPQRTGMTKELVEKVEDFTVIVLLPVFFLVAGLRTNLLTLDSMSLIGWLLLILAVATVGKFAGCGVAARLTGASTKDAVVVGALMNTRGLTELVILNIGLSLGVLSDRTFAMMVIMALVTTATAPPIVSRLMPRERVMREIAAAEAAAIPAAAAAAGAPAVRVLVALGNPLNAPALVDAGLRLTGHRRPAELVLVRLIPTPRAPEFVSGLRDIELQTDASIESMKELVARVEAAGVRARSLSFLSDDVGQDLARLAADQRCDTILLGWHRASLERHVVRALVHRVFRLAPCDVIVFVDRRGRGLLPAPDQPVLVALAGGAQDEAVTRFGLWLAQGLGTSTKLLAYLGREDGHDPRALSEQLALTADRLRQANDVWVVPRVAEGDGLRLAVEESEAASAIVAGVNADWPEGDFGSVTTALAEAAACPVLVVHAPGTPVAPGHAARAAVSA